MAYLSVRHGRTSSTNFKGRKLTPKMLSFVNAYFGEANFNSAEAVRLSDYRVPRNVAQLAAELMNHPLVQEEVKRRLDLREQKSEVKAEFLINKLMEIIAATQEDNPQAALRAIELAGKSIALWKERQEISGIDGQAIRHEQEVKESVADFTGRIAGLAKRAGATNVIGFPGPGRPSGS